MPHGQRVEGLEPPSPSGSTLSVDHQAPLSDDERLVLRDYLVGLRKLTWGRLDADARASFEELERSFEHRDDFAACHLEVIATAKKP